MFSIELLNRMDPQTGKPLARIIFDEEEEIFPLFSDIWTEQEFEAQWLDSIARLFSSKEDCNGALVTEIYSPKTNLAVRWWALYREGGDIWIREQLLARDELPTTFRPECASEYVRQRRPLDDS